MKYARGGMTSLDYLLEIQRLEDELKKYDWVSVKDRLPEKHGWYLTAHKRIYPTDTGMKICFFYHGSFTTDMEVTYWMSLPEYPESEDDAE